MGKDKREIILSIVVLTILIIPLIVFFIYNLTILDKWLNDYNLMLSVYTIIFMILSIIEINILIGFKLKYFILEIIGSALLLPIIHIVFVLLDGFVIKLYKNDLSGRFLLDNIPNYFMLYLIIKIIIDKKGDKNASI